MSRSKSSGHITDVRFAVIMAVRRLRLESIARIIDPKLERRPHGR